MSMNSRRLLIGAVALVKGRVKDLNLVLVEVCDEIEPEMARAEFLFNAPFSCVSLILRLSTEKGTSTEIRAVDKRNSELPIARTLDLHALRQLDRTGLKSEILRTTLAALRDVASRYSLPYDWLPHETEDVH